MKDNHIDLDELSLIWKSNTPPAPKAFNRQLQSTRLKMIAMAVIETMIGIIGSAMGIYLLTIGSLFLGFTVLAYSLASLAIVFWSRSGVWNISTGSVKTELQTSIKQAGAQYRYAWGGIWVCSFALVFLAVLAYQLSMNSDQSSSELAQSFQYFSFALVFVAVNLIVTSVILEKARKKLHNLKQFYKNMVD